VRALQIEMFQGQQDEASHRERMRGAAERAYALDPDLGPANIAMGLVVTPLVQSLQYLRRAVEIDPSNGDAYQAIADQIQDFESRRVARAVPSSRRPSIRT